MSKGSVNKVILIGRLGADPESRSTPGGATVTNVNIATNRRTKDRDGNWVEETDWHRIVFWNRLAEIVNEYTRKGTRIYVEGRLQTRSWEDQSGQKKYMTEVVANEMQLLDSRDDSGGGFGGGGGNTSNTTSIPQPDMSDDDPGSGPDDVPF